MEHTHSPEELEAVFASLPAPSSADARQEWQMESGKSDVALLNRVWDSHNLGAKRFFGSLHLALRAHHPTCLDEWEKSFTTNLLIPSRKFWVAGNALSPTDAPVLQDLHPDFASATGAEALAFSAARLLSHTNGRFSSRAVIDLAYLRIIDGTWEGHEAEQRLLRILAAFVATADPAADYARVRASTDYEDAVWGIDAVVEDLAGNPRLLLQSKRPSAFRETAALLAASRKNEERNRRFLAIHPTAEAVLYTSSSDLARGLLRSHKRVDRSGVTLYLPSGTPTKRTDVRVLPQKPGFRAPVPV